MQFINEQIQRLKNLLDLEPQTERVKLIKEFQDVAWGTDKSIDLKAYTEEMNSNKGIEEILLEIAYDLDFYEPNDEVVKETPSFYGEEKLKENILIALQRIEKLSKN